MTSIFWLYGWLPFLIGGLLVAEQLMEIPRKMILAIAAIAFTIYVSSILSVDFFSQTAHASPAERDASINEFALENVEIEVLDQCLSMAGGPKLPRGIHQARWCGCLVARSVRELPDEVKKVPFEIIRITRDRTRSKRKRDQQMGRTYDHEGRSMTYKQWISYTKRLKNTIDQCFHHIKAT